MLKIVECPRDAMQGIQRLIPTELKINYINALLRAGFDTLDFGSFVSPQAVPQMADTHEVVAGLDMAGTSTRLLAIVANMRGAEDACRYPVINYLGYPFSISETFQIRNTRKTIAESLPLVHDLQQLTLDKGKELVVYISMAFGNPYGDAWNPDITAHWVEKIAQTGVKILALADTVGTANSDSIYGLFDRLIPAFPEIEFGGHFHAHPQYQTEKLEAAWSAGCRRFDSAMMGFGGCPFAEDELVGNISTESLIAFCETKGVNTAIHSVAFSKAAAIAQTVFG
ncbi:MAG: hydroxymethylglutaryl-CoA lyase [Bacteroidia bacterium]|nr:hydroxymethylglutaryl-CoA lyase [Bacteroidia bacterium]